MRNVNRSLAVAAGAVILGSLMALSAPNDQAFAPAQKMSQTNPFQIMLNGKNLPEQTIEHRTIVFAETRAARWQREASQNGTP